MNRSDLRLGLIMLGVGLLLGLGITATRWLSLPQPQLAAQAAGLHGPLTLTFAEPMQAQSVELRLSFDPAVPGGWVWGGAGSRSISFWPSAPFPAGKTYTLRLQAGARAQNGRTLLRPQTWQVTIRQPAVVYLSPSRAPDLWRVSADTQERVQLTATGGKVFDYGVSADGDLIAYSVRNADQGFDLWEMDRNGGNTRLLLPCGADWCINPAYDPNGGRIAYSRRKASGVPGSRPGMARLWMLDRSTLSTDSLFIDPNIGGAQSAWSPDGQWLAVVDEAESGVRLLDLLNKSDFLLPAGEGTALAWSPDSQTLYYTAPEPGEEQPAISVFAVDPRTRKPRRVLGSLNDSAPLDYSVPTLSPDGAWLVYARREVAGNPAKQLWLQKLDGSQRQALTDDPLSNVAHYHWDPTGSQLIFQRLALGASTSQPEVAIWSRADGGSRVLAENAFQPDWIP